MCYIKHIYTSIILPFLVDVQFIKVIHQYIVTYVTAVIQLWNSPYSPLDVLKSTSFFKNESALYIILMIK